MGFQEELKSFKEKVSQVYYFVSKYGTYTMFKGEAPADDFDKEELNRLVLDGFKKGQDIALVELAQLQLDVKSANSSLKEARRNKDKILEKELLNKINFIECKEVIFKNLVDTIVWQLIGGQHYILRRLYTHEKGGKDINTPSFEAVIHYANEINKDRESICVIADIASNIHLGDCLVVNKQGISIVEIKSGETNIKAIEQIANDKLDISTFDEEDFKAKTNAKYAEQIKRMLEQKSKNKKAADILLGGSGVDPKFPKVTVTIPDEVVQISTYHDRIQELIKRLDEKDWAYECIEAVVHIGVYKGSWLEKGRKALEMACGPYPVYDLLESTGIAICEPIFIKPLPENIILDLITEKIKIYIAVDYEKLIEFSNFLGIPSRWSTSKELSAVLTSGSYNSKEIFSFENKGIIQSAGGKQGFIGQGFMVKIMFDHFLPSSMLLMEGKM